MSEETLDDWWKRLPDDEKKQARNAFDDEGTSVNISSNVLFHFTDSRDKLISILTNGFYPKYCPEYGRNDDDDDEISKENSPPVFAFPMICFCDLPLFLIKKHLSRYGPYGVGMKKSWGMKVGISPVLYFHPTSKTQEPISNLFELLGSAKDEGDVIIRALVHLIGYQKSYEGLAWRRNHCTSKIRFYNEREWRYVPPLGGPYPMFLERAEYQDQRINEDANDALAKSDAQMFTANDVLYTIVSKEEDVDEMILTLRGLVRIGGNKDEPVPKDIQILETTVSSAQRIMED